MRGMTGGGRGEEAFFLLNAAFAMAVLDLISRVKSFIICYHATQAVTCTLHVFH